MYLVFGVSIILAKSYPKISQLLLSHLSLPISFIKDPINNVFWNGRLPLV